MLTTKVSKKKKKYSENNCDLFRTFHDHNFAEKDFMRAFELAWLRVELKVYFAGLKSHNTFTTLWVFEIFKYKSVKTSIFNLYLTKSRLAI